MAFKPIARSRYQSRPSSPSPDTEGEKRGKAPFGGPYLKKVMKKIKLSQNKFTIVDNEDYENLSMFKWYAIKRRDCFYAARKHCTILMHRVILNLGKRKMVDHKNGNGLDNRKTNLRICNYSQNSSNQKKQKNTSLKFKGIRKERGSRFSAQIMIKGRFIHIGSFTNQIDAARAYDKAAEKYFGSYAKTNKDLGLYG